MSTESASNYMEVQDPSYQRPAGEVTTAGTDTVAINMQLKKSRKSHSYKKELKEMTDKARANYIIACAGWFFAVAFGTALILTLII